MFKKLSGFGKRVAVGKTVGFVIGLVGFFMLPIILPAADSMTRWGILLWYTTFGAIIGVFGVMDHHPLFKSWKFPAWFRGILIGGWLNFVLVFFAHEQMSMAISAINCPYMTSPFWFVLEGAIIGLIIDLVATKYGGEGSKIF